MSPDFRLNTANLNAAAITCLSIANVWLCVQNTRWFMYSAPINRMVPGSSMSSGFDIPLEIPGLVIGIVAAYFLLLRFAIAVWHIRFSLFQASLMMRVLSFNTLVLVALTGLGIIQWVFLFDILPLDLVVAASLGAVASLVSHIVEFRLVRSGTVPTGQYRSLAFLRSLSSMWGRPKR